MTYPMSLSRDQVRDYDRQAIHRGVAGPVLMENAARGALAVLEAVGAIGPFSIVCGKGNNAGDGFVMARMLASRGAHVVAHLLLDPSQLTGDAATAFAPLAWLGVPIERVGDDLADRLRQSAWVIDALLGTGATGAIREPFAAAIEAILRVDRPVLAVDLPSGMDCDTGLPLGPTVRAAHTATFVARKRGFDNPASEAYTGAVHVVPIGLGSLPTAEPASGL